MSIRNVYDEICSYENIIRAEKNAAEHKHYDWEVLLFRGNYEENIYDIVHTLRDGKVPPTTYRHFYVYIPKLRKVIYIDYVSKIIERAIYNVINPLVCKGFIEHSYSCIPGRGQLLAMQDLQKWLRYCIQNGKTWYYYKFDVEKFFYRMDHDVLMEIVGKKIQDDRTVKLIEHYVREAPIPFGLPLGITSPMIPQSEMIWDVGIPIGGGLSHMLANMYMDVLDHECKRKLRIKYYTRYMDDTIVLSDDKSQLHEWGDFVSEFLWRRLKLNLNNRSALRPIGQGIEYVGYRIWPHYVTLRKSTSLRMKKTLRTRQEQYRRYALSFDQVRQTVASYRAMLKHCDCRELDKAIWTSFVLTHNPKYMEEEPWMENSLFWSY